MLKDKFIEAWKNDKYRLSIFKATTMTLAVTILVLSFMVFRAAENQKIIILPSQLHAKVETDGRTYNDAYIKAMGAYLVNLIYTYTPQNIESKYAEFLHYVPVRNLDEVRGTLDKKVSEVNQLEISENLNINRIIIAGDNNMLVDGNTTRFVGGTTIGTDQLYLRLSYQTKHGGFNVVGLEIMESRDYNDFLRRHNRRK